MIWPKHSGRFVSFSDSYPMTILLNYHIIHATHIYREKKKEKKSRLRSNLHSKTCYTNTHIYTHNLTHKNEKELGEEKKIYNNPNTTYTSPASKRPQIKTTWTLRHLCATRSAMISQSRRAGWGTRPGPSSNWAGCHLGIPLPLGEQGINIINA